MHRGAAGGDGIVVVNRTDEVRLWALMCGGRSNSGSVYKTSNGREC